MQYRDLVFSLLLAALLLSTACRDNNPNNDSPDTVPTVSASEANDAVSDATASDEIISTVELDVVDFEEGTASRGMTMTESGMTVLESMDSAELIAPIITATHSFNYLFPEWKADVPITRNRASVSVWLTK